MLLYLGYCGTAHECGCIYGSCKFSLYLGKYPEVELLNHLVVLVLTFEKVILFSAVAVLIFIPTNPAQEFSFSASWPTLFLVFSVTTILTGMRKLPYCSFVLVFPDN